MPSRFRTTRWSLVRAASASQTARSRDALGLLCELYWKPLYYFARRHGAPDEEARDLVQSFLTRMLERGDIGKAEEDRGRFRTFLLTAFKHFLRDEWQKGQALKRGGGETTVIFDETIHRAALPYAESARSPEQEFDRQWALALLAGVLHMLEREYHDTGRRTLYGELQGIVSGDSLVDSYAAIGERLGLSEGAVKTAAHRLKARYKLLLREHVAQTLVDFDDTKDELGLLMEALST